MPSGAVVTLGGAGWVIVAIAVRVVALAMALCEHRRELLGKSACRLAAARLCQAIFAIVRGGGRHVATFYQPIERVADIALGVREKARHPGHGGSTGDLLPLHPVEQLQQLVLARDRILWL